MKTVLRYLALLCILILMASTTSYADGAADTSGSDPAATSVPGWLSSDLNYVGYIYLIDSYDVAIVVNENNTFDITERISAWFNEPRHGIIRSIPLSNRVERLDGTVSLNRAKVENVEVDSTFELSSESGDRILKIGDADFTLTGPKDYTIRYTYGLGRDPLKDRDEFYFNIIGQNWDTAIGNITFSIVMPKEFDQSKLGFSHGSAGSTDSSGISYQVNGNAITGSYDGVLNAGEALTVRLELPEDYFVNTGSNFDLMLILSFIIPILCLLSSIMLWIRFGNDEKVVETVEFYPPEGFNSAEVGFLYKGKADNNDAISLLVYLASKGYLRIDEIEERSLFVKTKSFKLTKLKDYEGDNENERLFLAGLFSTARKPSRADLIALLRRKKPALHEEGGDGSEGSQGRLEVTSADLYNSFYVTVNKIVQNLNKRENRYTIFEKRSLGKGGLIVAMIIATYIMITARPVVEYGGMPLLPFALLFPGIGFTVLFGMVFGKTKLPVKIFGLVWGLGFGGMPWATLVLPALMADTLYLAAYIAGLACVFGIVMLLRVMPKRTPYGNELLGKIRGFKTFLESAEKPKLESLVLQDPAYFYNILPYTYVLGVSDKWIKKFEEISLQAPDWYGGSAAFNMASFGAFMESTMSTASASMSSSSSGSGGSGGGSSGGGSGGGGGGSW